MAGGDLVDIVVDAAHQDAGEQEIREHHDAREAEPDGMLQRRLDERKGDAGIRGFAPAEAHPLPQHAHDLDDIGVGVGIGRSAADDDQQRIVTADPIAGRRQRLAHPVAGRVQHLQVDAEFPAVVDRQAMARLIGVQNGRDVVLGMAGGEQYPRHRQHLPDTGCAKPLEAVGDDRPGELQIAVLDFVIGQPLPHRRGDGGEFGDGSGIAATMATHHHARFFRHSCGPCAAARRRRRTGRRTAGRRPTWAPRTSPWDLSGSSSNPRHDTRVPGRMCSPTGWARRSVPARPNAAPPTIPVRRLRAAIGPGRWPCTASGRACRHPTS